MWLGATSFVFSNQKVVSRLRSSPLNGTVVSTRSKALSRSVVTITIRSPFE